MKQNTELCKYGLLFWVSHKGFNKIFSNRIFFLIFHYIRGNPTKVLVVSCPNWYGARVKLKYKKLFVWQNL